MVEEGGGGGEVGSISNLSSAEFLHTLLHVKGTDESDSLST